MAKKWILLAGLLAFLLLSSFSSQEEPTAYVGEFEDYNPGYYRSFLTGEERQVYNAVIYMTERGVSTLSIPSQVAVERAEQILWMAASDYPSLESNLAWMVSESYDVRDRMLVLDIASFMPDKLRRNLEALEVAKRVVAAMPAYGTDYEKGRYLYRYLVENVDVQSTMPAESTIFLYSALVERRTNCDGFANALSLLYNMAGIPTIKVQYHASEVAAYHEAHGGAGMQSFAQDPGHIWNIALIDGRYTHVDANTAAAERAVTGMTSMADYAFPDSRAKAYGVSPYLAGYVPACTWDPSPLWTYSTPQAAADRLVAGAGQGAVYLSLPTGAVGQAEQIRQLANARLGRERFGSSFSRFVGRDRRQITVFY